MVKDRPALGSCEENYRHTVGGVEVCKARFYPETGVKEEHFVLELSPIDVYKRQLPAISILRLKFPS